MPREDDIQTGENAAVAAPAPAPSLRFTAPRLRERWVSALPPDWLPLAAIILSLAYYYLVPAPLLALPGLLAFAALAWLRLDLALCALPLTFPFWYVPKHVGGSVVFPLSEIALAICAAIALARIAVAPPHASSGSPLLARLRRTANDLLSRLRIAGRPTLLGAALLLLGTALGVLIARRPHEALRAFRWEIAEPLLYAALVLIVLRKRHLRLLVGAFLGAALLLAALAAVQVLWLHVTFLPIAQNNRLIPYIAPSGAAARATAFIFGSGNTLGAWMARALPLALALALAPRRSLARRYRALAFVVALACLPALLWSASRGALLAAALACAVVAILSLPRPRWSLGVTLAGLLAAAVALLANRAALLNIALTGHNGSGEVRTLVWLAALHMIRDHPLLGIGPDQFLYYYSSLYTTHPYWILYQNGHRTLAWTEPNLAQPHNLILDLWLSGGLLALAGFTLTLAAFWLTCWRAWHATHFRATARPAPSAPSAPAPAVPAEGREPPSSGLQPAPQPAPRAPAMYGRDPAASPLAPQGEGAGGEVPLALGLGASILAGVLHGMVDSAYFQPDLALLFWWAVTALVLLVASEAEQTRLSVREE